MNVRRALPLPTLALLGLVLVGCPASSENVEPPGVDAGGIDVAIDVATDSPGVDVDAASDAPTDADASAEAAADADAAIDGGVDADASEPPDGSLDAPDDGDATVDVATDDGDATVDVATDAADEADVADAALDAALDVADDAPGAPVFDVPQQQIDGVGPSDTVVTPDGQVDGTFDAVLVGPITGLILATTDASGTPASNQQWDTITGSEPLPKAELGLGWSTGYQTWVLGVYQGTTALNPGGALSLGPGVYPVTLVASSSGYFHSGQHFRLFTRLGDGVTWAASPVSVWP